MRRTTFHLRYDVSKEEFVLTRSKKFQTLLISWFSLYREYRKKDGHDSSNLINYIKNL